LRHGVEVGGLYIGMTGESAVPVALIIGHHEYDMWLFGGW
jgi:high-affinity Fe2+/Pb2+ permease